MRASGFRGAVASAALTASVWLSACSITGLGGSDEYGCKAPPGVKCNSVSGTYYNSLQNNLPSQRQKRSAPNGVPTPGASSDDGARSLAMVPLVAASARSDPQAPAAPRRLRSEAKVLRLWFKAYEDSDRDLNEQGFVYVQIDAGQWLIEHAQRSAREAFAPIRPPRTLGSVSNPGPDSRVGVTRPDVSPPHEGAWFEAQRSQGLQGAAGRSQRNEGN